MQKMLNWIGWIAVMHGPFRLTVSADNPIGRWCLPRAGGYAYGQSAQGSKE